MDPTARVCPTYERAGFLATKAPAAERTFAHLPVDDLPW
jgi:hypothetical protein